MNNGFTPSFAAALITGPETYPPVPMQISGLNSFIIFFASIEEVIVLLQFYIVNQAFR